MRRLALVLVVCLAPAAGLAQDNPQCIEVRGFARWAAAAYNHVVRVENGCDRAARCEVATNVSPEPRPVTVPAGEHVEVLTFRGSPAREFTPRVRCALVD